MSVNHKRKDVPTAAKEYRKFDENIRLLRRTVIKSYAKQLISTHADGNGGNCRRGFVKELVSQATQTVPLLLITRDDINNEA